MTPFIEVDLDCHIPVIWLGPILFTFDKYKQVLCIGIYKEYEILVKEWCIKL